MSFGQDNGAPMAGTPTSLNWRKAMAERLITCAMCNREQLAIETPDVYAVDAGMLLWVCPVCVTSVQANNAARNEARDTVALSV